MFQVYRPIGVICADGRFYFESARYFEKQFYVRVIIKTLCKFVFCAAVVNYMVVKAVFDRVVIGEGVALRIFEHAFLSCEKYPL